jgi:hypothetical protein
MPNNLHTQPKSPSNTSGTIKSADETTRFLAYVLTIGFFGLVVLIMYQPLGTIDSFNQTVLGTVLGSIGTAWLGAMAYFFGAAPPTPGRNQHHGPRSRH